MRLSSALLLGAAAGAASSVQAAPLGFADFEARGRVVRDGSDLPRLGRARKIMTLATALGIVPSA